MSGNTKGPGPTSPPAVAIPVNPSHIQPIEGCKEPEYDPAWTKSFSKGNLRRVIEEYNNGKFSPRYMEVYLDFVHMEGVINNLEYLEYKTKLKESGK